MEEKRRQRRQLLSSHKKRQRREHSEGMAGKVRLKSDNAVFNEILDRSAADLAMLTTPTPYGPYPYAGVPWFCDAVRGDGIITALFSCSGSTLTSPKACCATGRHPGQDNQSASRCGARQDPARTTFERDGQHPARCRSVIYYGSVDATPLFVILAGLYWRRTGDLDTIIELWPHIEAALAWTERLAISTAMAWSSMRRKPGAA